jgi:hypothetical protein
MAFQTLSKDQAVEFMGAKRQVSPRADNLKYVEYVKQIAAEDIAGMIDIRGEVPEGSTAKEISSKANVEVSRIKTAAKAAGVDLMVVKRGDKVIFRPIDEGETPNAGPNAPEPQQRGPRQAKSLEEYRAEGTENANGSDEDEDETDEDEEEATEEAEVETAGGSRRRAGR